MTSPVQLPSTTWIPGEGERPDDAWLRGLDHEALVNVGVLLFERGQGFEAHEAWELAWRDARARGDVDQEQLLHALIKLAAAMVKVRQHNSAGVRSHAAGARALLEELVGRLDGPAVGGFVLAPLAALAQRVEAQADQLLPAPVGTALFGVISRLNATHHGG